MPRLVVVSNRLPFTLKEGPDGWEFTPSAGGLVTALSGYLERERQSADLDCVWVGWAGHEVPLEQHQALREMALEKHGSWPIFLTEGEADLFYHGFCNKTIWPLFHYFPSYADYDHHLWNAYVATNQRFCDELAGLLREDDIVWVHDYQLLLLPGMLRHLMPDISIGFFLHIPFPTFELFRLLPSRWRRDILEGMLGADLVGFHTFDYTQYFLRSVYRTLGHDHHLGQIQIGDRIHRADTFPIGIDYAKFADTANSPQVKKSRDALLKDLGGRHIIFSVDRLDYSKGLLHRLRGYEEFLATHPEWHGKVCFVLAVVPSREEVAEYKSMRRELNEAVGLINGRFGGIAWAPIIYQYRSTPFADLVALYCMAEVALITPLRDGMNLVAKEYVACRTQGDGVLILSEMAGAARELGEAIQVNPNHRGDLAEALAEALAMPPEEQIKRMRPMQERLRAHDATWWARTFLDGMRRTRQLQGNLKTQRLTHENFSLVRQGLLKARKRLLLLDYDGTLVPFASLPHLAVPDEEIRAMLKTLADNPRNTLYIISGRDRPTLQSWLGDLPLNLIAEHGAWIKPKDEEWRLLKPLAMTWKDTLRPILQTYVDRLSGSLLEEKDYSLAWHYRLSDPELAQARAKELVDDLVQYTANFDVQVLEGKKVIEIRNAGVNKGAAAQHAAGIEAPDFILAMGDDQTDEDLFRAMPPEAFTIRVGQMFSHARFSLRDQKEVRKLLAVLLE